MSKVLGINVAVLKDASNYNIEDLPAADVAENWYAAREFYQFPGEHLPFDSCNNDTSVATYASFTQVHLK